MIFGVGTDLLDMRRVRQGAALGPAYLERVFSPAERARCGGQADPGRHYAAAFCAKEAVFKALHLDGTGVDLREIETSRDGRGAPAVRLTGRLAEYAREQGAGPIHLSLSWEGELVQSFAVIEARM